MLCNQQREAGAGLLSAQFGSSSAPTLQRQDMKNPWEVMDMCAPRGPKIWQGTEAWAAV